MARINSGINPKYLSDQHLIAESVEITMITGSLRKDGYVVKGQIPEKYCLGKGHINFFKNKVAYLHSRLREVNIELTRRGIKNSTWINLSKFPKELWWDAKNPYSPNFDDSFLVRNRVCERLISPLRAKPGFHRYYGTRIDDMEQFCERLKDSELFYV